jgi:hypothetical protein
MAAHLERGTRSLPEFLEILSELLEATGAGIMGLAMMDS